MGIKLWLADVYEVVDYEHYPARAAGRRAFVGVRDTNVFNMPAIDGGKFGGGRLAAAHWADGTAKGGLWRCTVYGVFAALLSLVTNQAPLVSLRGFTLMRYGGRHGERFRPLSDVEIAARLSIAVGEWQAAAADLVWLGLLRHGAEIQPPDEISELFEGAAPVEAGLESMPLFASVRDAGRSVRDAAGAEPAAHGAVRKGSAGAGDATPARVVADAMPTVRGCQTAAVGTRETSTGGESVDGLRTRLASACSADTVDEAFAIFFSLLRRALRLSQPTSLDMRQWSHVVLTAWHATGGDGRPPAADCRRARLNQLIELALRVGGDLAVENTAACFWAKAASIVGAPRKRR